MQTIETTGKTPEEAIEAALKQLGVGRDEVQIDVVRAGRSGLLGIGSEPAVVRVTLPDAAEEADADIPPADHMPTDSDDEADADVPPTDHIPADADDEADADVQPVDASHTQSDVIAQFAAVNDDYYYDDYDDDEYDEQDEDEEASEEVKISYDVLSTLLNKMDVSADVYLRQAYSEDSGGPVFEIEGEDSGLLIGSRGETLRALQFIANFLVGRRLGSRTNMFVDVEGYQQRRYDSIANLARRVAQSVAEDGRPIALEPMPPNERRQVHMALADHEDVITESDGNGTSRRVVIHPR